MALGLSKRSAAAMLGGLYVLGADDAFINLTEALKEKAEIDDPARHLARELFELFDKRQPNLLADFAMNQDRLRALAKWHAGKPADRAWLRAMSEAIRLTHAGPRTPGAIDKVLRLAASVNETAWAQQRLLPLLGQHRIKG